MVKVTSARATYLAKAMVTRRIKPMTIDGKKIYQIGIPIHQGFRGIQEDAGRVPRSIANLLSPTVTDPNAYTPEFKGFLVKLEKALTPWPTDHFKSKPSRDTLDTVPGKNTSRDYDVCKLIDVTTCIGCKACEVACLEWNGYPFRETVFDNTYQTMPDTAWNYYNLIRFNEFTDENGNFSWLMRKDQCMHCADPGCLRACPADGAIVQYTNGIVDFQQDNCIGCQYCVTGCPFNIPKFNPTTKKVHKCTLCSDRVGAGLEPACIKACPTGCLHFGTKDDMKDLAETRVAQLREHTSHKDAGVYDPPGVERHARHLRAARHQSSGTLRRACRKIRACRGWSASGKGR